MKHVSRFGIILASLLLLAQSATSAAGSATVTATSIGDGRVVRYTIAWVSDASGNVSGVTTALSGIKYGYLQQFKLIPDAGGTAPTALYDVTLVDANGVDLLAGAGANLSATVSTLTMSAAPIFYDASAALDLGISNAGNAKGGTLVLWISPTR